MTTTILPPTTSPARALRRGLALLFGPLLLASGLAFASAPEPAAATPSGAAPADLGAVRSLLLAQHNEARARAGLPPLAADPALDAYAQDWSVRLSAAGSLSHSDLGRVRGVDPARFTGRVAENVAMGQKPHEVAGAWTASPGHYANMVHAGVDTIGVGYALDANGTPYYTTVFADNAKR
ncbi:MAG: CAP domain-containing protein [Pseudoclavibacter sp.]|nr:CAP domain-containing protein [Pseudoclavibacter sp.]